MLGATGLRTQKRHMLDGSVPAALAGQQRFFHRIFQEKLEPFCPMVFTQNFRSFSIIRGHGMFFSKNWLWAVLKRK
jgi:hypothetical protein